MRVRIPLGLLLMLVAACDSGDDENLRAWMDKVRRESHPVPLPLSEPMPAQSMRYEAAGRPDPFDPAKISAALNVSAGGVIPDLQRPREPLESYPLDSLRMVGSLRRQAQTVALVEAEKILYQVRAGNHLGQDQGTVLRIDETSIEIEEIVQETAGTWGRRRVRLAIQEKK